MVSLTLAISKELKKRMDQHNDINWSAVARRSIEQKMKSLETLRTLEEFSKDSELTEEDAIRIGREINKAMVKRWKKSS
jgi:hypothetical protein